MIFNVTSIIVWFGCSGGIVNSNCSDGDVCVKAGPGLAIASNFTLLPSVGIFLILYCRRCERIETVDEISLKDNTVMSPNQGIMEDNIKDL